MRWLIAGVAVSAVAGSVDPPPQRLLRESELRPLLLRPSVSRTVSKPFLPLLIDLYWLRLLNAIGEVDSPQKNLALYDYGVILTELDPRFYHAYTFVGLNVPFQTGRNVWVNGAPASDMFRRGLAEFPKDMPLHLYLGFNLFNIEKKYREASVVFAAGSTLPRAPPFMAPLATRLLSHSGDAREGLALAQELAASATEEAVKEELLRRVRDLEVEVLLQQVDAAIATFTEREGRDPTDLSELISSGDYRGPGTDVKGGTVSVREGKGHSTSLDRRLVLYE